MQQPSLYTCRDLLKARDGATALASLFIFVKNWPWARWGALWLRRRSGPAPGAPIRHTGHLTPGRALGPEQGSGAFLPHEPWLRV